MSLENLKLASLENFFWQLLAGLHRVRRWGSYPRATDERVDQHTLKTVTLTLFVLLLERRYGRKDIDAFTVLAMALIHDWGEGSIGDVVWQVKRDPRVKQALQEIEGERLWEFLEGHLPDDIKQDLEILFGQLDQNKTAEGRLFAAIEFLGYLSFAIYEVKHEGRKEFVQVFRDQYQNAANCAEEFASIRIIWEQMKTVIDPYMTEQSA